MGFPRNSELEASKMKRVSVSVQNDYLERMSQTRPINAVAELVWNSLDADADKIRVKLFENEMGGLEKLTVTDNGHGLDYSLAEQAFGSLGGSWKRQQRKTRGKKRLPHCPASVGNGESVRPLR